CPHWPGTAPGDSPNRSTTSTSTRPGGGSGRGLGEPRSPLRPGCGVLPREARGRGRSARTVLARLRLPTLQPIRPRVVTLVRGAEVAADALSSRRRVGGCGRAGRGSGEVEERAQLGEGRRHDGVVRPAALLFAREQAGVDELLHVVADGGLADAERFGEVARADRIAPLGDDAGE